MSTLETTTNDDDSLESGASFAALTANYDGDVEPAPVPLTVVIERTTEPRLRRRPAPPLVAPVQAPPSLVVRVNDSFDVRRARAMRACGRCLERCYAARNRLVATFVVLVTLGLLGTLAVSMTLAKPSAHRVEHLRPMYARHGYDGVDLHVRASELSCSDIASPALRRARTTAEHFITTDALHCVCGPMFQLPRRYMAIRTDAGGIVHTYNPVIDATWDGNTSEWSVLENQRMLFPDQHRADVRVVRRYAVRLSYRDDSCAAAALILQEHHSYCAQACADLFDGRSVYDVAL